MSSSVSSIVSKFNGGISSGTNQQGGTVLSKTADPVHSNSSNQPPWTFAKEKADKGSGVGATATVSPSAENANTTTAKTDLIPTEPKSVEEKKNPTDRVAKTQDGIVGDTTSRIEPSSSSSSSSNNNGISKAPDPPSSEISSSSPKHVRRATTTTTAASAAATMASPSSTSTTGTPRRKTMSIKASDLGIDLSNGEAIDSQALNAAVKKWKAEQINTKPDPAGFNSRTPTRGCGDPPPSSSSTRQLPAQQQQQSRPRAKSRSRTPGKVRSKSRPKSRPRQPQKDDRDVTPTRSGSGNSIGRSKSELSHTSIASTSGTTNKPSPHHLTPRTVKKRLALVNGGVPDTSTTAATTTSPRTTKSPTTGKVKRKIIVRRRASLTAVPSSSSTTTQSLLSSATTSLPSSKQDEFQRTGPERKRSQDDMADILSPKSTSDAVVDSSVVAVPPASTDDVLKTTTTTMTTNEVDDVKLPTGITSTDNVDDQTASAGTGKDTQTVVTPQVQPSSSAVGETKGIPTSSAAVTPTIVTPTSSKPKLGLSSSLHSPRTHFSPQVVKDFSSISPPVSPMSTTSAHRRIAIPGSPQVQELRTLSLGRLAKARTDTAEIQKRLRDVGITEEQYHKILAAGLSITLA